MLFRSSAPARSAAEEASPQFRAARRRPAPIGPEVYRYQLAKQIPGFGGYFYDRAGNMHVYLTDLKQSHRARARLRPILRARPTDLITEPSGRPRIILHQGRYDFPQLAAWRDLLRQQVLGRPSIVGLGIDIRANAVSIGAFMSDPSVAGAYVRELIKSLPIPPDAVTIEAGARANAGATLSSFRDTLEGGLKSQLSYGSTVRDCTMGFNAAADDGTRVFLTNSHCTAERGGANGTTYWQPDYQVREIGTEYRDPNWLTYLADPRCPNQMVNGEQVLCRYSDAALVRYHAAMTTRASIARTTFNSTGAGVFGSTTIDPAAPYLAITESRQFPAIGDPFRKSDSCRAGLGAIPRSTVGTPRSFSRGCRRAISRSARRGWTTQGSPRGIVARQHFCSATTGAAITTHRLPVSCGGLPRLGSG